MTPVFSPSSRRVGTFFVPTRIRQHPLEVTAKKFALALDTSIKYIIPFASGVYVGMADGKNQEIEPIIKYTLLTAPTVANVGLVAIINGFAKIIGNLSKNQRFRHEVYRSVKLETAKAQEVFRDLEKLADTKVIKNAAKAVIKPGIMVTSGYAIGYGFASIT